MLEHYDVGPLQSSNIGMSGISSMEHCDVETSQCWNIAVMQHYVVGTL